MNGSFLLAKAEMSQPHISIFGIDIAYYALIIVSGMILAFFVISLLFRRRNMSTDLFLTYFVIGLPVAIITTRLFYCITDGMPVSEWFSIASIKNGGLSIVGGILGGLISVIAISFFKKANFFRVGDCVVVGLLLAQSIGRWGNYVNQEVYGRVVANEALHFFPVSVYIEATGEWHYAFCVYESVVTLTAAILLFLNAWKNGKKPNGINVACYFIVYGLVRSIMEPLRDEQFILSGGGVPWSLIFSLAMLFGGLGLLGWLLINNKRKEGKIFGSASGEEYGIVRYIGDNAEDKPYFDKINMMCALYPDRYPPKPAKKGKERENTEEEQSPEEDEEHEQ